MSSFLDETANPEIYDLSLHDALPISRRRWSGQRCLEGMLHGDDARAACCRRHVAFLQGDRKSTRLNSSHVSISYAVFCLKKKSRPLPQRVDVAATPGGDGLVVGPGKK